MMSKGDTYNIRNRVNVGVYGRDHAAALKRQLRIRQIGSYCISAFCGVADFMATRLIFIAAMQGTDMATINTLAFVAGLAEGALAHIIGEKWRSWHDGCLEGSPRALAIMAALWGCVLVVFVAWRFSVPLVNITGMDQALAGSSGVNNATSFTTTLVLAVIYILLSGVSFFVGYYFSNPRRDEADKYKLKFFTLQRELAEASAYEAELHAPEMMPEKIINTDRQDLKVNQEMVESMKKSYKEWVRAQVRASA